MRGRSPAKGAVVIKAVLFDLDDTLLRLNLTAFIARYVAGAARLLSRRSSPATSRARRACSARPPA